MRQNDQTKVDWKTIMHFQNTTLSAILFLQNHQSGSNADEMVLKKNDQFEQENQKNNPKSKNNPFFLYFYTTFKAYIFTLKTQLKF